MNRFFLQFLLQSRYTEYEFQFYIGFAEIKFHRKVCTENETIGIGYSRTRTI